MASYEDRMDDGALKLALAGAFLWILGRNSDEAMSLMHYARGMAGDARHNVGWKRLLFFAGIPYLVGSILMLTAIGERDNDALTAYVSVFAFAGAVLHLAHEVWLDMRNRAEHRGLFGNPGRAVLGVAFLLYVIMLILASGELAEDQSQPYHSMVGAAMTILVLVDIGQIFTRYVPVALAIVANKVLNTAASVAIVMFAFCVAHLRDSEVSK